MLVWFLRDPRSLVVGDSRDVLRIARKTQLTQMRSFEALHFYYA